MGSAKLVAVGMDMFNVYKSQLQEHECMHKSIAEMSLCESIRCFLFSPLFKEKVCPANRYKTGKLNPGI